MNNKDVNIRTLVEYRVPDHQILLTFSGDDQAYQFYEYWDAIGKGDFIAWANKPENRRGI
jgi:hypothetical protein